MPIKSRASRRKQHFTSLLPQTPSITPHPHVHARHHRPPSRKNLLISTLDFRPLATLRHSATKHRDGAQPPPDRKDAEAPRHRGPPSPLFFGTYQRRLARAPSGRTHRRRPRGARHPLPLATVPAEERAARLRGNHHQCEVRRHRRPLRLRVSNSACLRLLSITLFSAMVNTLTLRAGSTLHNTGGIVHPVTTGYIHQSYDTATLDYDIAILKVKPYFSLGSTHIQMVNLPEVGYTLESGTELWVSGWGTTLVSRLQTAVSMVPTFDCSLVR